ncbi:hypothetical protein MRX96_024348 [Rhipicephalus microplus]
MTLRFTISRPRSKNGSASGVLATAVASEARLRRLVVEGGEGIKTTNQADRVFFFSPFAFHGCATSSSVSPLGRPRPHVGERGPMQPTSASVVTNYAGRATGGIASSNERRSRHCTSSSDRAIWLFP